MSSSSPNDPTRRVPKKLGESDEFWRGYTLDDLLVGGTPFIVAVLLTAYVIPPEFRYVGYVLGAVALVVGAAAVYATPDHLTASEWVSTYAHHLRRPKEVEHVRYDFDSVREQTDFPESRFHELSERTQELTDVKRVHTNRDAVERLDGAFVGAVRVESANMALATDRRWQENVASFADFFNNSVEWNLQMYSTTTEFPIEDYLRRRERRLGDEDVTRNPVFRRLIEEWLDWYPQELEARGTNIREHYIIVSVRRDEVDDNNGGEDGILRSLCGIPVVGRLFGFFVSDEGLTEEEVRARALSELAEGFRRVNVRLTNHPGLLGIDRLRSRHVSELVTVEGTLESAVQRAVEYAAEVEA